jgi:hypothetical protein
LTHLYCLYVPLRQVSNDEAEKKAQELGCLFIETSAKAGYNVKALFRKIAQALPGMEAAGENATQLVDVKLNQAGPGNIPEASSCSC